MSEAIKIWFSVMRQQIKLQERKIGVLKSRLKALSDDDHVSRIDLQLSLLIHTKIRDTKRDAVEEMKVYAPEEP